MVKTNRRMRIAPFLGAMFCFFLTFMTLGQQIVGWGNNSGGLTTFISFLPMCFLYMGFTIQDQQDRIQVLEASLAARDEKPTE
ncbi:MAG: hypothetical protein VX764_07020 [Planctomycetota bacterium]|nr:hypothetical protein [Planctomycetota bacterium]